MNILILLFLSLITLTTINVAEILLLNRDGIKWLYAPSVVQFMCILVLMVIINLSVVIVTNVSLVW